MKWFKNMKIKNKLLLTQGILVSMLVVLAIISSFQLFSVNQKYSDVLSTSIGRQSSTSKALADMNTLNSINLRKGFLTDGTVNPSDIVFVQVNYYTKLELLMNHLSDYRNNVGDTVYLTEAEKQERLELLDEIVSLLTNEYQQKIIELDAALFSSSEQEINRVMGEAIEIGERVVDKLNTLYNLVSLMADKVSNDTTEHSRRTILLLFGIAAFLFMLSVLVSIVMTRFIKAPITQMGEAMLEISKGNLAYPIRSGSSDELGMLSNKIGDMVDSISEMNKVMTVMDNLDSMIIVIDFDYNMIYINRSLADAYGVDIEDYKGKKCYKILKNNDKPCSICQMPKLLPDKHSFPSRNYEFLYDDYLDAWLGGRASIIRWADGSMVYFLTAHFETEKKKSQEQLSEALMSAEKALKAKSLFLANMSHELRTPLNVIVGLAELQLEDDIIPVDVRKNLQKISTAGNTLLSIVNDLLDISKIESGSFILNPVEYHVASLLNDTIVLITSRIGEKPVVFQLNITDALPSRLYGDDLRVKQILNNLLSNAVKYTHKGSIELEVSCVRENEQEVEMIIAVKDTGIGIRPDDLKKIFSDYNQVDNKANRMIEGTGLGLPITKKLVENMGGGISVESEYGKGSTFQVRIRQGFVNDTPIGATVVDNLRKFRYNENKRHFANTLVRADLSYARVLVVDDLQANLEVAAGLMRKYKMQVDCITSGQAAIERIKRGTPVYNAIFMDHMMPVMDGIEAADIIRGLNTDYAKMIPIIALTANAVVGTEELFYEHGFQAFITKPIDIMRLDSVIIEWIKNKSNDNIKNGSISTAASSDSSASDSSVSTTVQQKNSMIEIPGLNADTGLQNCGGDQGIYHSVLHSYVADTLLILAKIQSVTEDTLSDYSIAVHGIKGASANIGAEAIRAAAADLEKLSQNLDLSAVLAKNEAFLNETESLVMAIKGWLDQQTEKNFRQRLPEPDQRLLVTLRQRCEEFDAEGINEIMDKLYSVNYDSDADLIAWLREKVDLFEYPDIVERLKEYGD